MPVLPQDPAQAVDEIIKIVESLIELTEKELTAHLMKDGVTMVAVQGDKEVLTHKYEEAAKEFAERIEQFRTVDKARLDKLDSLQRDLSDRAKESMNVIKVPVKEEKAG